MSLPLNRAIFVAALLSGSFAAPFAVQAHVPYLQPASFEPIRGGWISLDAAFAERFFIPEVAFDNSQFSVLTPAGAAVKPALVQYSHTRTTAEHQLTDDGTYRFSTGLRYGAVFHTYEQDGERKNSRDENFKLPAGAKSIAHFQAVTRAETYVSKGAPSHNALKSGGEALELEFLSHPNDLYTDSTLRARVLFNGKPLAQQAVSAYFVEAGANDEKVTQQLTTDAAGIISFKPEKAGTYLLLSRYRADAPASAKVPQYSYSYSVVLEVTQ